MAGDSVGKIDLDLGINFGEFQKELTGISNKVDGMVGNAFKRLGGVIAGAFAVSGLVHFGKDAIQLASDLNEVQNVVDVTFGSMAAEVNAFADTALQQFGLSELSAKRYTSVLGAMLKSSGLTGDAIRDMSTKLTGLSADFASFYNLGNDEAFEKIRSGLAGEVDPLQQLGINLSVANLEAYALSKGIKKSWTAMTQAEQVLLRYNYLLSVSSDAQGDFARTSTGWANQTRLLSEQWKIFQGTMGQGFINILAPAIKWLNALIAKLQVAAEYFKAFTAAIFGDQQATSGAAKDSTAALEGMGGAAGDAGKDVKKAGKAIKGSLGSFDDLNLLSQKTADALDDSAASFGAIGAAGGIDLGKVGEVDLGTDAIQQQVQGMVDKVKPILGELGSSVKSGLSAIRTYFTTEFSGVGDVLATQFQNVKGPVAESLRSIGESALQLKDNFLSPVANYILQDFVPPIVNSFVTNFAPVFSDVLVTAMQLFADTFRNITSTVSELWANTWMPNIDKLKNAFIESMPTIATSLQSLINNTIAPFMDYIINQFIVPISAAIQKTFVPIFTDIAVFAIKEFAATFKWAINLINDIYKSVLEPAMKLIKKIVLDTLQIITDLWKKYGETTLKDLAETTESIRDLFQSLWDKVLKPIIEPFLKMLSWLWDKHLKALVEQVGEFVFKLVDSAMELFNGFVMPIINWLIDLLAPGFVEAINIITDVVGTVVGVLADVAKGIFRVLGGIIDFITGVFTGNWRKAWEGVKDIFGGIFDVLVGVVKGALNLIIDAMNIVFRGLNKISIDAPDWVPGLGGKTFGINIPQIPKLAEGGLVSAPALAMVGDNKGARTDPEVVSPLSKLQEMLNGSNAEVVAALASMIELLRVIANKDPSIRIGDIEFGRAVNRAQQTYQRYTGQSAYQP
jgi:phage-related protein